MSHNTHTLKKAFSSFLQNHKMLCAIVCGILILCLALIIRRDSLREEDKKESKTDNVYHSASETDDNSLSTRTTSVGAPEVKDPVNISQTATKDGWFYDAYYKFCFQLPEGYHVMENQDIIYIRSADERTQIAIIYLDGTFENGIDVYNQSNSFVYKQKAYLQDQQGISCERALQSYGRGHKETLSIGDFLVSAETGTAYYANKTDLDFIKTDTNNYFTTWNGDGIALMGISQTIDNDSVFGLMDSILLSWTNYIPDTDAYPLEWAKFEDNTTGISFQYPDDWSLTKDDNSMTIIKAPESQTNIYAGTIIEFFADPSHLFVTEYSQFSANYEAQILIPTFTQGVKSSDFTYDTAVTKMQFDAKIKEKPCCYYEVTDRIFPASRGIDASIGISGSTIHSKRWCFKARNIDCMLNIIIPESAPDISESVIQSMQSN